MCLPSAPTHWPLTPDWAQVVHHFPAGNDYEFLSTVLCEIYRVLTPGGALVLNVCSREQVRPEGGSREPRAHRDCFPRTQHENSYWWLQFMPKACEEYCKASPPLRTPLPSPPARHLACVLRRSVYLCACSLVHHLHARGGL